MASVNKVMLLGNLTRDPELRYTPQGTAVCSFGLALNHSYKNKQTGQKVEDVTFIEVEAWARTGEITAEYVKKGSQIFIEGRLKQDRWETPDGRKTSRIKVIALRVTFVGSRPGAKKEGESEEAPPATDEASSEDIPF